MRTPTSILSLSFLSLALAHPSHHIKRAPTYGVTSDASSADGQTFDYIIIGAGLAGTTVAARLAEVSSNRILLIEAGGDDRNDARVYNVHKYLEAKGTEIMTSWQTESPNREILGGTTLGGSSSINGATWTRGMAAQYDAMTTLLEPEDANAGWDWNGLFSYMKKAETFSAPNDQQRAKGANSIASYHGTSGPVQATFPDTMYGGPQQPAFVTATQNLTGIRLYKDLNGGNPNCVSYVPHSINWHEDDHRSSAATAYLSPVESQRKGWLTLVNNRVTKILFKDGSTAPHTATGIEFGTQGGALRKAYARREVIVAAGALATPALLQLSGIGDAAHLSSLGIQPIVDLKTVGRNLQEQTANTFGADGTGFDNGGTGPSDVIAFPNIDQLFGSKAADVKGRMWEGLGSWANMMADSALSADALRTIYNVQAGLIANGKCRATPADVLSAPVAEVFFITGFPK
ncbi:GMC oxidoreductase-domain-containing protein [Amylostereum chailletii]|nr:GMC oxidoreductase-domain-containing protein [Amylostereum chailletii]